MFYCERRELENKQFPCDSKKTAHGVRGLFEPLFTFGDARWWTLLAVAHDAPHGERCSHNKCPAARPERNGNVPNHDGNAIDEARSMCRRNDGKEKCGSEYILSVTHDEKTYG